MCRKPDRAGIARRVPRKKAKAEILVLNEEIRVADFAADKKIRIVAVPAEPEGNLQQAKQQDRRQKQRQPENPQAAGARPWRMLITGLCRILLFIAGTQREQLTQSAMPIARGS